MNKEIKVVPLENKKVEIDYPCNWEYRLVGMSEYNIKEFATKLAGGKPHTLSESKKSSTGKFCSIAFEVLVHSEDERLYFYEELLKHQDIKYIL